ncbi:ATP-binding protein [Achromobacter sp. 413638]|uniref:ATP-binding protein n=1 Tax=Achromobacter sp. 413638 TaxID=3342385 RepID=UPI00370A99B1
MIKFILRILVVAIVSFFVAYFMVDRSLNYFFRPQIESVALRAVRGELHALHKELDAIAPADRARILHAEIAPLYGADIHLLPQEQVRLGDKERDQLARLGVVFREDNGIYLFPLPGEPAQWLQVRQPGDSPADRLLAWSAWLLLSLIVATALFLLWALPIWRDLNVLRNATQLIGQGDLGTRVRLSRVAGIRHVGESFNQMAERIAALIENQRSLTNAVSHELRTPLARLAFEVDLLRQDRSGARREHILQDMQADIDELESMVAELLVYARLERPTDDMMPQETIDARDWLGDTLAQVDHLAQARAVRCVVHGDCPPQVRLHRRYMSRALLNLVQNAVRYASRLVHVSLAARADGAYELIVDDDGPGIPARDRDKIFEPFIRLDESRDRGTGGAGLGLAIVQRVAAAHHGDISVHGSPLGGARFILRWPAPEARRAESQRAA